MATKNQYIERSTETIQDIATDIIAFLRDAGQTIGVAESLTAGGVMMALTSVPGASEVFRGGFVTYATELKEQILNVDRELIAREGVIHADVAAQMAHGARGGTTINNRSPTTWGIGTTGVAGPDPQDGKTPGTVFIGIASPNDTGIGLGPFFFPGNRENVRNATIFEALFQLRNALGKSAGRNVV